MEGRELCGMADLGTIVKTLLDNGYAVVCPNHRSSMDAEWPAQINDIRAVIRFVRGEAKKYHFDPSFIATSGFSSGGHLSSTAATTSGMKTATFGEHMSMGANSPEDVLLKSKLDKEPDKYKSLSPVYYVNKNNPPIIIFHGGQDKVVPNCQGKKFFELLKAAGVKTEGTFPENGNHGGAEMYTEENLQKMVKFLNEVRKR